MKAILVIDMPEQCDDCDFCQGGYLLSYLCGLTGEEFEFVNGERKQFCPLKPLPDKIDQGYPPCGVYYEGYGDGWDDCIDKILGEKE